MTEIKTWDQRDQGIYGEFRELRIYEEIAELRARVAELEQGEPVAQVSAEEIQWRNIRKVVYALADLCFGSKDDPKWGIPYIAITNSLTSKDGIRGIKLEPLDRVSVFPVGMAVYSRPITEHVAPVAWQHCQRSGPDAEWQEWHTVGYKPQGPESDRFKMRPLFTHPARPMTEKFIDEFLEDYTLEGEDEEGRSGCYRPNETELMIIKDAVIGLWSEFEAHIKGATE